MTIILLCGENLFQVIQILYAPQIILLLPTAFLWFPGTETQKSCYILSLGSFCCSDSMRRSKKKKNWIKKIEEERKCGFLLSKSDLSPPHHPTIAGSTDKKKERDFKAPHLLNPSQNTRKPQNFFLFTVSSFFCSCNSSSSLSVSPPLITARFQVSWGSAILSIFFLSAICSHSTDLSLCG